MADRTALSCAGPDGLSSDIPFEEARDAFSSQKFWVSFFVRPCCPPPAASLARQQLDIQRDLVRAREDFTEDQKQVLLDLIDKGEAWYKTTPYWGKGASA